MHNANIFDSKINGKKTNRKYKYNPAERAAGKQTLRIKPKRICATRPYLRADKEAIHPKPFPNTDPSNRVKVSICSREPMCLYEPGKRIIRMLGAMAPQENPNQNANRRLRDSAAIKVSQLLASEFTFRSPCHVKLSSRVPGAMPTVFSSACDPDHACMPPEQRVADAAGRQIALHSGYPRLGSSSFRRMSPDGPIGLISHTRPAGKDMPTQKPSAWHPACGKTAASTAACGSPGCWSR